VPVEAVPTPDAQGVQESAVADPYPYAIRRLPSRTSSTHVLTHVLESAALEQTFDPEVNGGIFRVKPGTGWVIWPLACVNVVWTCAGVSGRAD
jgi:hypothetical protein